MKSWIKIILLVLVFFCLTATPLLAMGVIGGGGHGGGGHGGGVPEIDPSFAPAALAILSGGVLILKSRFKRK